MRTEGTATLHPVWTEHTQQQLYRRILETMAYPGRIADCAGILAGERMLIGVAATLIDHSVSLGDPDAIIPLEYRGMIGARDALPDDADWLVADGRARPPKTWRPRLGSITQPEISATLILTGLTLGQGRGLRLTGPGIETTTEVAIRGLDPEWVETRRRWCARPPIGIDLILVDETRVLCLPRTTTIEEL